ncbi:hypothetical protein V7x_42590 [Crateriforma conspicua]|uniref:Uncharacterized protein n=1 Tax=Crateriforma conspicua TaxID=2527996 RepID=A0A5C6FMK9_9PLAN|nr:hypothetical protein V7x_42590 [Crateriforma conspicua]
MSKNPYEPPNVVSRIAHRDDFGDNGDKRRVPRLSTAFFLLFGVVGTLLGAAWIMSGISNYRAPLAHIGLLVGIYTLSSSLFILWAIIRRWTKNHSH